MSNERLGYCWNCGSEIIEGHEDAGDWLDSHLCGGCDDGQYKDRLAATEALAEMAASYRDRAGAAEKRCEALKALYRKSVPGHNGCETCQCMACKIRREEIEAAIRVAGGSDENAR